MFVRTTKFTGVTADQINPKVDAIAEQFLPELEREWGLVDGFVLVNHAGGAVMGVSVWDNETAMRKAGEAEAAMRDRVSVDWRSEPVVETWEIALSHNDLLERGRAAIAAEVV